MESDLYKCNIMQNRTDRNFFTVQSNHTLDVLRFVARALDRTADAEHMARLVRKSERQRLGK